MSARRPLIEVIGNPGPKDLVFLRTVIEYYMRDNFWPVFTTLCSVYIFLQAFAIPGPAIIAILMAALFGGIRGGIMSLACALIGSSICYYIFKLIGRPILRRFFAKGLASFKAKLDDNKDNIFFYFLFLRITPLLPNFFINIASGNVGISYRVFLLGSLFGLIPNAVILARAGVEMTTLGGFDAQRALGLIAIGLLALLPVLVKRVFKNKVA